MDTKLSGKTALILGGTGGMGLAAAKAFLKSGAKVIITGRDENRIEDARNQLDGLGSFELFQADIGDFESTKMAINSGVEKLGKLDIFYQVGGMFAPAPLMMADQDNFETTFRVNLMGPIMALINARDYLNDNASVILTTTTISTRPVPGMSSYAASKAGLDMFGKTIALELADRGIRVNIISPGATDTPAYDKIGLPEEQIAGFKQFWSMVTPLKSMGSSEDIANAALFLASNDSSQITGIRLDVDGGLNQSWHLTPEA